MLGFQKGTFKSKTTWGTLSGALLTGLFVVGAIPLAVFQLGAVLITAFTGVAVVDRTEKIRTDLKTATEAAAMRDFEKK